MRRVEKLIWAKNICLKVLHLSSLSKNNFQRLKSKNKKIAILYFKRRFLPCEEDQERYFTGRFWKNTMVQNQITSRTQGSCQFHSLSRKVSRTGLRVQKGILISPCNYSPFRSWQRSFRENLNFFCHQIFLLPPSLSPSTAEGKIVKSEPRAKEGGRGREFHFLRREREQKAPITWQLTKSWEASGAQQRCSVKNSLGPASGKLHRHETACRTCGRLITHSNHVRIDSKTLHHWKWTAN